MGYAIIPMEEYLDLVNEKNHVQELKELLFAEREEKQKLQEKVRDLEIELDSCY